MAIRKTPDRNEIKVRLWGREIGTLTWVERRRQAYFHFSEEYFRLPYDLCPLTCPKDSPEAHNAIYGDPLGNPYAEGRIYQGLPPFIADSLPDQWGNMVFDNWFRDNGLPESAKTPLTKLSFIGTRAMGALEFFPVSEPGFYKDKAIDIDRLYEESLAVERQLSARSVPKDAATTQDIAALGTSPGGSRKKALVAIDPDGVIHPGQIPGGEGWKQYIVKFNTEQFSLSETEKTYYDLATACGIRMMPSLLFQAKETRHFMTERFDRRSNQKVFMQTLAAINPEARTYEDLFATCRRLGIGEREITDLFRQTAFNFILNNTDDHRKNFSFLLDDNHTWHLTPAYDITFILADKTLRPETNHCMSLRGKYSGVTDEDLVQFARENQVKAPGKIIAEIREKSLLFEKYAMENGVNGLMREVIARRLDELGRRGRDASRDLPGETGGLSVQLNLKGSMTVSATVDGKKRKKTLPSKHPIYRLIMQSGLSGLTAGQKSGIVSTLFQNGETPGR